MFDLDRPTFSTEEIAAAAGIKPGTLNAWFKRYSLRGAKDVTPGSGRSRNFSLRRALHLAITAQLVNFGITPEEAANLAYTFTDVRPNKGSWGYTATPDADFEPGIIYKTGTTFLLIAEKSDGRRIAKVIQDLTSAALSNSLAVCIVNLSLLDAHVRAALRVP